MEVEPEKSYYFAIKHWQTNLLKKNKYQKIKIF